MNAGAIVYVLNLAGRQPPAVYPQCLPSFAFADHDEAQAVATAYNARLAELAPHNLPFVVQAVIVKAAPELPLFAAGREE